MEEDIFKLSAVGLTGAVLAVFLRQEKKEYGMYVGLATVLVIVISILDRFAGIITFFAAWQTRMTCGKLYLPILLKVLGIAYISDFTAQVCKDAGEGAIASKVELSGKVLIFYLAIPVMMSIFELVDKLLPP